MHSPRYGELNERVAAGLASPHRGLKDLTGMILKAQSQTELEYLLENKLTEWC